MRLLNVHTYAFEIIYDIQTSGESYAILSHTWAEGQEPTHQDWLTWQQKDPRSEILESKRGFRKIIDTCKEAKRLGHNYVWIDTICIDKSSSADLSEAINSMFAFYTNASVCFAFLADVNGQDAAEFRQSRWFTRGWTLQELLAPKNLVFYDRTWAPIGTRLDRADKISRTTGIHTRYLLGLKSIFSASVAERMSWAANRKSTRREDSAYCLLGIFDINMPLMYGENDKAFVRLQEEILKVSTDHSIFAWTWTKETPSIREGHPYHVSFLAPNIGCFANSGTIIEAKLPESYAVADEIFAMTNLGLSLRLPLIRTSSELFYAILQCSRPQDDVGRQRWQLCIPVLKTKQAFVRCMWPRQPLSIASLTEGAVRHPETIQAIRWTSLQSRLGDGQYTQNALMPRMSSPKTAFSKDGAITAAFHLLFELSDYKVNGVTTTRHAQFQIEHSLLCLSIPEQQRPPVSKTRDDTFVGALIYAKHFHSSHTLQILVGVRHTAGDQITEKSSFRLNIRDLDHVDGTHDKLRLMISTRAPRADEVDKAFGMRQFGTSDADTDIAMLDNHFKCDMLAYSAHGSWRAALGRPMDGLTITSGDFIRAMPVFIWISSAWKISSHDGLAIHTRSTGCLTGR